MYFEVELRRKVLVLPENLGENELVSQRCIVTQLLKNLSYEKASKDEGYFLTVSGIKSIGSGQPLRRSRHVFFPVTFTCRTFMPYRGEILQGVVHHISRVGAFMSCGPVKLAYLSILKMPGYHYVPGDVPFFLNNELSKINTGVVVQFVVLDVRWIEKRDSMTKEFQMLASLDGDNLGPISSCEL
ncbi:DNA-directed RNA polymerase V subunit 7-like [Punica granatum]|uniref:DNA-directed RNA polymerase subunit n=2 Tax=Punica granatum TaxID=22663 RepID=A0A218XTH8_PUNGR|nr:DNA-directed RNA polymerase V subunit 7-like [Punica granatum]OWM87851.1 hypothetical protein CDL15_Pgr019435 [Punica granatum]PKI61654.1 hypothetical protein CRG98_017966 [Punica granatum]